MVASSGSYARSERGQHDPQPRPGDRRPRQVEICPMGVLVRRLHRVHPQPRRRKPWTRYRDALGLRDDHPADAMIRVTGGAVNATTFRSDFVVETTTIRSPLTALRLRPAAKSAPTCRLRRLRPALGRLRSAAVLARTARDSCFSVPRGNQGSGPATLLDHILQRPQTRVSHLPRRGVGRACTN